MFFGFLFIFTDFICSVIRSATNESIVETGKKQLISKQILNPNLYNAIYNLLSGLVLKACKNHAKIKTSNCNINIKYVQI